MPTPQRKIVAVDALAERLGELRRAGRAVVHCHGCFDLVHPGHVRYLQGARQLGDVLVVSLTGDSDVNKGPDRPYIPQELRAESLAALEFVDWVVIDPHPTAVALLRQLRPDIYVKGREYAQSADPRFLEEQSLVESYGGRVVFHSGDVIYSSTRLIQSLRGDEQVESCRLRALCERSAIGAASAVRAVEGLRDLGVLIVGDSLREEYVLCDAGEAAEDAPILEARRIGTAAAWGGAARLAEQFAALGARPILATGLADDELSRRLADDLVAQGIDLLPLPARGQLPLRHTFIADDSKLLRVVSGTTAPPDSVNEKRNYECLRERIGAVSLLLWHDLGFGLVTSGLAWALTAAARRADVFTGGMSSGARTRLGQLRGAELLYCSERRLRDEMHDAASGLSAVAYELLAGSGGRRLIVSLAKRGLIGFDGRGGSDAPAEEAATELAAAPLGRLQSEFVPHLGTRFVDAFGRDEAVLAVAGGVLASGGTLAHALYLASAAEALVVSRTALAPPRTAEILDWLARREELRPSGVFVADTASRAAAPREAPDATVPVEAGVS